MILLDSASGAQGDISDDDNPIVHNIVANESYPAIHKCLLRVHVTWEGTTRSRNLFVRVMPTGGEEYFEDFVQNVTHYNTGDKTTLTIPVLYQEVSGLTLKVWSDNTSDDNELVGFDMYSDDPEFYLTYRAAETSNVDADSLTERIKAIDDLTQASGGGDLAAINTQTTNCLTTDNVNVNSGVVDSNMEQIDGLATNDNLATLKLKALSIVNDAAFAKAVDIRTTGGSSGSAVNISATGAGSGVAIATSSNTAPGMTISATGTLQPALRIAGSDGIGVDIDGTTAGMTIDASAGSGIIVVGSANDILADISATDLGSGATISANLADIAGAGFSAGTGITDDSLYAISNALNSTPDVNLTQIDGLTTTDGAAVLNLKQLNIVNTGGVGVVITGSTIGLDINATAGIGIDVDSTEVGVTVDSASSDCLSFTGDRGIVLTVDDGGAIVAIGGAIEGNITGSLSGSVDSVTNAVGSVTGHTPQTGDTYALANGATGFAAIDTVVDAIKVVTDALTAAAAAQLAASAGTVVIDKVASGYSETTLTLKGGGTATLSTVDDHYNGRIILFTSGVLKNQATDITDYDGTTKVFTFTEITSIPADDVTFVIV